MNIYSYLYPFLKPTVHKNASLPTPLRQEQKGLSVSFCRLCVSFLINLPQQPRDNEGVTRTQRKGGHKGRGMLPPPIISLDFSPKRRKEGLPGQ